MLDMLQAKVAGMLKNINSGLYADDWRWNDDETVIDFAVIEFLGCTKDGKPVEKDRGRHRFIYVDNDVFGRSFEEQADDWLEELSYRF